MDEHRTKYSMLELSRRWKPWISEKHEEHDVHLQADVIALLELRISRGGEFNLLKIGEEGMDSNRGNMLQLRNLGSMEH